MTEPTSIRMIVKQVDSGDSVILRDQPRGGPPRETKVGLCWITAPKMGRKSGKGDEVPEEVGAFEAREFLRKKLIGKEILFTKMYSVPIGSATRDCGLIYISKDQEVSVNEMIVEEGLAEVIKRRQNDENPIYKKLVALEDLAKDSKRGKWAVDKKTLKKRTVFQEISQEAADGLRNKTFKENAIVEYVQSADQMRVALLVNKAKNEWQMITLRLSGIKCPLQNQPFSDEAKFFVESRILHRDVAVRVEQLQRTGDNPILFGSVFGGKDNQHNIAIALLKEGLAQVTDITLKHTPDPQAYRQATAEAKSKRLRIWKEHKGVAEKTENGSDKNVFDAKVIEIINGDAMNVLSLKDKTVKKIFLSSIRPPPRRADAPTDQKVRALYDVPLMFEAREFLRKKLIGKKVQVAEDYRQPKTDTFPEKICATVTLNGQNIAEQLVSRGLATVVKHRADDDRKSSAYDLLMDAEFKAEKANKGIHGKDAQSKKIVDLSNDSSRAKQFMSFLVRSGLGGPRKEGLVEHVYSSSRIKVYIPKENCLINLILAGINSPKVNENEYGKEGYELVKSLIHQRDVELSIESMDKVGNYIGYVYYEIGNGINKNISLTLIEHGLATIRDAKDQNMIRAEEEAKKNKIGLWKTWTPEEEEDNAEEIDDDKGNEADADATEASGDKNDENAPKDKNGISQPKKKAPVQDFSKLDKVFVTEIASDASTVFVQDVARGPKFEEIIVSLRNDLKSNPPLPGAYSFKKGDIVAAKFSQDGLWYRARIDKISPDSKDAEVLFIDYGNRENVAQKDLAPLPSADYSINAVPAAAQLYAPAFISLPPNDLDAIQAARDALESMVSGKELYLRKEYRDTVNGQVLDLVSLIDCSTKENVGLSLVKGGFFRVRNTSRERRKDKRIVKLLNEFINAQEVAKKGRLELWMYGDSTEDDARDFI
ncbi:staphylococcal nuclease domain-containing protein 1-like isoform X2 [Brevipalpus obovatus]|uniref:staphylococcal nuclease domain-containing protein 1-like isoform X2 n=1 Tax=Brevipalpus obovatus TaxID=246614 RepID=UPI003D9E44E3